MLKCESRTSLHAVQYRQPGSVLMFFIILEMGSLDTLFLCSVGQQAWLILKFFTKIKAFVLIRAYNFFFYKQFILTLTPKTV